MLDISAVWPSCLKCNPKLPVVQGQGEDPGRYNGGVSLFQKLLEDPSSNVPVLTLHRQHRMQCKVSKALRPLIQASASDPCWSHNRSVYAMHGAAVAAAPTPQLLVDPTPPPSRVRGGGDANGRAKQERPSVLEAFQKATSNAWASLDIAAAGLLESDQAVFISHSVHERKGPGQVLHPSCPGIFGRACCLLFVASCNH
jgi:hypothetical protein